MHAVNAIPQKLINGYIVFTMLSNPTKLIG